MNEKLVVNCTCDHCGAVNEEAISLDDVIWCDNCVTEHFFVCTDCARYHTKDALVVIDGDNFCKECTQGV